MSRDKDFDRWHKNHRHIDRDDARLAWEAGLAQGGIDAMRWKALLGSARIRPLGSAGIQIPVANNYAHLGLELWTVFTREYKQEMLDKLDRENVLGREWLCKYADTAMAAQVPKVEPDPA